MQSDCNSYLRLKQKISSVVNSTLNFTENALKTVSGTANKIFSGWLNMFINFSKTVAGFPQDQRLHFSDFSDFSEWVKWKKETISSMSYSVKDINYVW